MTINIKYTYQSPLHKIYIIIQLEHWIKNYIRNIHFKRDIFKTVSHKLRINIRHVFLCFIFSMSYLSTNGQSS